MIRVGQKNIGEGFPCFITAEIGINHNGDMELARKMIKAAVECGADGVKFQNYYTEDFVMDKTVTYTYISQGKEISETQFDMFKRYELNFEQLSLLNDYCKREGVIFFSTPTSKRGVDDLKKLGVQLLKNGSDLLVNSKLISEMAMTGIPTLISTGMATAAEIDEAVTAFESAGGKDLVLLHCTSSYPTPDGDVNLNKIPALKNAFGYSVGFSDHTWGIEAAIASTVLGSCFIEKHFTLDRNLPGPDHRFSSDPSEFKSLVDAVRKTETILGTSKLGPTNSERNGRKNFRLSCAAGRDLKKGESLCEDDIVFLRPASGLHPRFAEHLKDKKLSRDIKEGQFILLSDLIH